MNHPYARLYLVARRRAILAAGVAMAVALSPAVALAAEAHASGSAQLWRSSAKGIPGQLDATAAISGSDVWSVGGTDQPGQSHGQTLVDHWNGKAWKRVNSPNSPGSVVSNLDSISAVSATDIWASGTGAASNGAVFALMEHWNGTKWTFVKTPNNPASKVNYLQAVSADAADDAWVAADYTNPEGVWIPYAEHWNGHTWSIVSVPMPKGSLQTFLTGVFALSATDAWIVGQCIDSSGAPVTLTEHWNGTTWSVVAAPSPGGVQSSGFSGVAGTSASDVWAVGNTTTSSGATPSLTEHWNGHKWSIVSSPNPKGRAGDPLTAVSTDGAGDVWAVGAVDQASGRENTLAMRWTGKAWTIVRTPSIKGAQATTLNGISVTSAADAWATGSGYTRSGAATTVNLHWNGKHWTIGG